ncbi:aspartic-type endopeptidase OPSB [Fusarium phyllophilum]|uniref:Aspartic-type endopeptidase OPSB n=1 Tax=Fusarium phyllophilum TaxID=47803 RepID=A0A8H5J2H4_9HYPO|nr:aspartic-type endopeptidase OPSB [Fusarium phyllophilum]
MKGSSLILSTTPLSCANALQLHKRRNPSLVSVTFEKRTKVVFPSHTLSLEMISSDVPLLFTSGETWRSLAQYNTEEAEDGIHEILRDVADASVATGVPTMYLKFDQPAESADTEVPTELPTNTATPLSTATRSGTSSVAALSTLAEAGDDEDNGAASSLPANLMYMMLLTFIFNVVSLAQ